MITESKSRWLHKVRFEFLLLALMMVLFNKIFVPDQEVYISYVWPFNMLLLGIASVGIFKEQRLFMRVIKNGLFLISILVPFFAATIFSTPVLSAIGLIAYIVYYLLIFSEVMRQITRRSEVTVGIVLGSVCGYLLLVVIATFSFLLLEFVQPASFNNTTLNNIPVFYNEIAYFSMITLGTIGYGDITPATSSARLMSAFFGIAGQFYMITLVGIIVSRFSSRRP